MTVEDLLRDGIQAVACDIDRGVRLIREGKIAQAIEILNQTAGAAREIANTGVGDQ